ncbi:hypothetical protein Dimus_035463 [Dionaea muscipula]
MARSQGKKVHITVEQEYARLLGNLAWAYLQQNNYEFAEEYYRKALSIELDRNKQCNLAVCLLHMNKVMEAKLVLHAIKSSVGDRPLDESCTKSFERASQLLAEVESRSFGKDKENVNQNQGLLAVADKGRTYTPPVVVPWRTEPRTAFFTQPKTTDRNGVHADKSSISGPNRKLQFDDDPPLVFANVQARSYSYDVGRVNVRSMQKPAELTSVCKSKDQDKASSAHQAHAIINEVAEEFHINNKPWKRQSWNNHEPQDSTVDPSSKEDVLKGDFCMTGEEAGKTKTALMVVQEQDRRPICKSKKSWADMVEEEEMFSDAFQDNNGCYAACESSAYPSSLEDENLNSDQTFEELLSQKFMSFELEDRGGSSVSGESYFPAKGTSAARRSLCFGQQEKVDLPRDSPSSRNSEPTDGSKGNHEINANDKMSNWRHRLPAFQDIVLLPISPRA